MYPPLFLTSFLLFCMLQQVSCFVNTVLIIFLLFYIDIPRFLK
nr:MAG TPA: hypothetical protein [Caudoviricetes sp.]